MVHPDIRFSMLVNGTLVVFFQNSRGLRPEDSFLLSICSSHGGA